MKKGFILMFIMIMLVVSGCGAKKSGTMTCTLDKKIMEGTTIKSEYKVKYAGKYVSKVDSKEVIKSNSDYYLETVLEEAEKIVDKFDNIDYYDSEVELDGNTLVTETHIDYANIDTDKLLEIDSSVGLIIRDGKVAKDDLKLVYEAMGATCK